MQCGARTNNAWRSVLAAPNFDRRARGKTSNHSRYRTYQQSDFVWAWTRHPARKGDRQESISSAKDTVGDDAKLFSPPGVFPAVLQLPEYVYSELRRKSVVSGVPFSEEPCALLVETMPLKHKFSHPARVSVCSQNA